MSTPSPYPARVLPASVPPHHVILPPCCPLLIAVGPRHIARRSCAQPRPTRPSRCTAHADQRHAHPLRASAPAYKRDCVLPPVPTVGHVVPSRPQRWCEITAGMHPRAVRGKGTCAIASENQPTVRRTQCRAADLEGSRRVACQRACCETDRTRTRPVPTHSGQPVPHPMRLGHVLRSCGSHSVVWGHTALGLQAYRSQIGRRGRHREDMGTGKKH